MNYYKISLWICLVSIEFLALMPNGIKLVTSKFNASGAIEHMLAFVVLYILLHLAYRKSGVIQKVAWLLIFAIQLEIIQYFVPTRTVNVWDIVADMLGVVLIVIVLVIRKHFVKVNSY